MTPLLWPLWCAATRSSFSRTRSRSRGKRSTAAQAVDNPTMPAPITTTSKRSAMVGGAAGDGCISHLGSLAAGALFPVEKHLRIVGREVLLAIDLQCGGGLVNPLGRPFDFSDVADRRLVENDLAAAVRPFLAEFFVAEARLESQRRQNGVRAFAIIHTGFSFPARLMNTTRTFRLVRQRPLIAIAAQSQQFPALLQLPLTIVVKGILFE